MRVVGQDPAARGVQHEKISFPVDRDLARLLQGFRSQGPEFAQEAAGGIEGRYLLIARIGDINPIFVPSDPCGGFKLPRPRPFFAAGELKKALMVERLKTVVAGVRYK